MQIFLGPAAKIGFHVVHEGVYNDYVLIYAMISAKSSYEMLANYITLCI